MVRHFFARDNDNGSIDLNGAAFTKLCDALAEHTWPGNVRELETVVKRLTVLGEHDISRMARLAKDTLPNERDQLLKALTDTDWNRRETARLLGISEGTIRYRMKKLDINEEATA